MKIAYLHGLESSIKPKDPKIIFLNNNFDEVYTPSINYKDDTTFDKLFKHISRMQPDLIVGSSMGGYVSYLIGSKLSIPVLLFNPAMVGRSFDPVVDDSNLKRTKIEVMFGKGDAVISGKDVRKYFRDNGVAFNHSGYDGGHRVPADVFINSIKKVTGVNEIYNVQNNIKMMKNFEQFVNEKASLSQLKKDIKTKEYKELSRALDDAQEVSDIWNMLDPKMFKFTESEFEDIFEEWFSNQMRYYNVADFSRNAFMEDVHSLYLHLLPYVSESVVTEGKLKISGAAYDFWDDRDVQRKLKDVKVKIVGDLGGVLTISGEDDELQKVKDILGLSESVVTEKREDVGKYNTVKKVVAKLGKRPSEQELATFINNNYYDVTEVERGEDDPQANDKIADLVAFYKFDIDDWEIAWSDAQNESVVTEASKDRMIKQIERALKDGTSIFKLPMATQKYYYKNKGDFGTVTEGSARDPESIRKEYKELKKQSIGSLRTEWSRIFRVGDPKGTDKIGLISDILRAKHGNKYVNAAFESVVTEGKFDGIADLVKSLHFEVDPKTAEEKKIELGRKQGEVSRKKQIESAEYSLRRFRKSINYGGGKDVGVFLPGSYDAVTSTLGDGPHAKAVKKIKWNQRKYDKWLEDVASNGGWENAFDMAQNAKFEPGLIDWVEKEFPYDDPMQRIQWDIEAFAESVVTEGKKINLKKGDKFKSTTNGEILFIIEPKGDGYDYRMSSDPRSKNHAPKAWFDMMIKTGKLVNESVVTEGKMPNKFIGNDEIVFLKTKENSRGAHYNLYYKGHDIDKGGYSFGNEEELKRFADNYILSNQWYNKLKYEDSKPLPESVVNEASVQAYALHMMADKVGQEVAGEFLANNNIDLVLLTKAIRQGTISKYELRDIVNGTAPKAKIKRFLKEFINESVSEEVYHPYDFLGMWAQKLGMTREEYIAHFGTPTIGSGIDEAKATDVHGKSFDVKGVRFTYNDRGRFYGVYLYDVAKTSNVQWRAKLRTEAEAIEFLALNGIEMEVPYRYDENELDKICKALAKQRIVCDHDMEFDAS